ncbi:MAG: thioredoxin-dependent thiol peroxidase [bacterium]
MSPTKEKDTGPSAAKQLEGKTAPAFASVTDTGAPIELKSLRGKVVVLFFYPKDDTSGCTVEVCSFRDDLPRFGELDAVVLGVSPDSVKSHVKFKNKYELPYTLIADVDHPIAEQYGVWGEKMMWGRKYWGVLRTTFVIDRAGKVAKVFEKVNPQNHAAEVAEFVASLA